MKCIKQWSVTISFFLVNSLLFPSFGNTQSKNGFPSLSNLKQTNVALEMHGFRFSSGLDEQGRPNWDGLQRVPYISFGSGFIVKDDGTIVTNYHIATKVTSGFAKFDNKKVYEIKNIKGYNPYDDITILKITCQ